MLAPVMADNPVDGAHIWVAPPDAVKTVDKPRHTGLGVALTVMLVNELLTVTTCVAVAVLPLASVTSQVTVVAPNG